MSHSRALASSRSKFREILPALDYAVPFARPTLSVTGMAPLMNSPGTLYQVYSPDEKVTYVESPIRGLSTALWATPPQVGSKVDSADWWPGRTQKGLSLDNVCTPSLVVGALGTTVNVYQDPKFIYADPDYLDVVLNQVPAHLGDFVVVRSKAVGAGSESTTASSGDGLPQWFEPTVSAMIKVRRLEQNWDSYGAKAINPELLNGSLDILRFVMRPSFAPPSVVPKKDGGIQLEWHRRQRDLEITISEDEAPEYFFRNVDTGETLDGPLDDLKMLGTLLGEVA